MELIDKHASRLGIQNLVDASYKRDLITESEGHPIRNQDFPWAGGQGWEGRQAQAHCRNC